MIILFSLNHPISISRSSSYAIIYFIVWIVTARFFFKTSSTRLLGGDKHRQNAKEAPFQFYFALRYLRILINNVIGATLVFNHLWHLHFCQLTLHCFVYITSLYVITALGFLKEIVT